MTTQPAPNAFPDAPAHILIVSADPEASRAWVEALEAAGHHAALAAPGTPALEAVCALTPDLCILDGRADPDAALDCCRALKTLTSAPLLLFSARADETDLLAGYAAGADLAAPGIISPQLFSAKVGAWLERARALPTAFATGLHVGGFNLFMTRRQLETPAGETIKLTALEARLLYVLMRRPGQPIDAARLVRWVWGYEASGDHAMLKNLVYRLRRKLEPDPCAPRYLVTNGNDGYSFQGELPLTED
jgi:two-component system, OmpR family, KDP operon response regulator KdpE